ncbi:peptidoglycan DD-metalloendopeptidase family protein [bacterium]|nr:peptidoglycan DD-metalloendopeptidase family protein [bacterium]
MSLFNSIVLSGLLVTSMLMQLAAQENPKHSMKTIHFSFADSLIGWAVGDVKTGGMVYKDSTRNAQRKNVYKSMIAKTYDGGTTWELQTVIQSGDEAPEVRAVYALDNQHCWIAIRQDFNDKDYILATEDGNTWKAMSFIHPEILIKKIIFTDVRNGWLIAEEIFGEDKIFRSADGGANWFEYDIGYAGKFHDILFTQESSYIVANLKSNPSVCSILRSNDGGQIWIIANEFKPDTGQIIEGMALHAFQNEIYVLVKTYDPEAPETAHSDVIYSNNGFVSFTSSKIDYEKESKISETVLDDISISESGITAVDKLYYDGYGEGLPFNSNLIRSQDKGRSWTKISEIDNLTFDYHAVGAQKTVCSNSDGEIKKSDNGGITWNIAEINFKNVFHRPSVSESVSPLGNLYTFMEEEDFGLDHDTTYASKWENRADSLLALNFSKITDIKKYKVDTSLDFAVGIDSAYSSAVVLSKRVRYGSKHQTWDLIKEEAFAGEIRIRKYKTIRLVGKVNASNGRTATRYSWSSSINGELSNQAAFTTTPKQLVAGTHYIFFKAMDDRGKWSDPMVIKVIVDDFPKYKFPFDGLWSAGGGGSYYNRGHHIRGIRYALDLNYQEGQDGGDSDYGIPVRASTDGIVTFAGYVRGYGRMVKIDYMYGGHKYTTLVSHLATISVDIGEKVKQGQEIGGCGTTGRSSAPHIHWELRIDDQCTPPEPIFVNDSTVVQSIRDGYAFRSDNVYQPEHIVVVDEGDIPNTYKDYRGYYHSYRYVGVMKNTKTTEATWKPKLPRSGVYKVQVHNPKKFATGMAKYRIYSKAGVQEVKVNQNKFTDEWVTLGTYEFDASDNVYIALDNVTGQTRGTIAFDAVRFIGQWENKHSGLGLSQ